MTPKNAEVEKKAVLIAFGSFNPLTIGHLRLLEDSKDYLKHSGWNVLGAVISPAHDDYKKRKPSLISSKHRIKMIELSIKNYDFLRCSRFEANQFFWNSPGKFLKEHLQNLHEVFRDPINGYKNYPYLPESLKTVNHSEVTNNNRFKLFTVCGGDLFASFCSPGEWLDEDIEDLVKNFDLIVRMRQGSDPYACLRNNRILSTYKSNIHIIPEPISHNVSSTNIRNAVKRGDSIKFFVHDDVIKYIADEQLYI